MNKIVYIVPYFGKLPAFTKLWLKSCRNNKDIHWLFFTDDRTEYEFPVNVQKIYMTFTELKRRISKLYTFDICLHSPYKLCDFKPAYGEIFKDEIQRGNYDFWGYCDIDLLFGDIRQFITKEILNEYDVIGFLGHSTIFRNTDKLRNVYRTPLNGIDIYKEIFTTKANCYFDEDALQKILKQERIKIYKKVIFADVSPLFWNLRIGHQDPAGVEKNKRRIFTLENGKLFSKALYNGQIISEEYMYIHFLRRKMTFDDHLGDNWLIIPNRIIELKDPIEKSTIIKYSKNNMVRYWLDFIKRKWRKITPTKVINYIFNRIVADRNGL